ncbi:hypothetical protein [Roseibacillus ishigakijimensis]|uniref:Uncharacterized protein n=1 Tax=Roseibacillus ishigakijimensis TaxID=454146 RepID=A0A934RUH2_9BACT|nr:hypothetical protein [Roseibacillus ishigakijimensis]MBK1834711.1 hypothetical protein [Roseibacillus ishigakijimensis]
MKVGALLRIHGKRHRWQVLSLVSISLTISWLCGSLAFETRREQGLLEALAFLEVFVLIVLTARVFLSETVFATFGTWRARPVTSRQLLIGAGVFLALVLFPLALVRLEVVHRVLLPDSAGWRALSSSLLVLWSGIALALALVIGVLARFTAGMEPQVRPRVAWIVIAVVVLIIFSVLGGYSGPHGFLQKSTRRQGDAARLLLPENFEEVWRENRWWGDGDWLKQPVVLTDDPAVLRVPLRGQSAASLGGVRLEVREVENSGQQCQIQFALWPTGSLQRRIVPQDAVLLRWSDGSFSEAFAQNRFEHILQVAGLPMWQVRRQATFLTPRWQFSEQDGQEALPQPEELFVLIGEPQRTTTFQQSDFRAEEEEWEQRLTLMEARLREERGEGFSREEFRAELWKEGSPRAVTRLLERGVLLNRTSRDVYLDYFITFADESHLPQLRAGAEEEPFYGEVMVRRGWGQEALPSLEAHLLSGRQLYPESVSALLQEKQEEWAPMMAKQLLRQLGKGEVFSELVEQAETYPGLDGDALRAEAWQRVKFRYAHEWLPLKWGAEAGDKEALRRLLKGALEEQEWEQKILEEWFPKSEFSRLSREWSQVSFQSGRWILGEEN